MANASFELKTEDLDALQKTIEEYGAGANKIVNDVLHDEGAQEIIDKIMPLIPRSGRSWNGKRMAAADTNPFKHDDGMLSVTIKTVPRYGYLYFPDDGSDTKRHAGNQQFMKRGAEAASPKIIELCIGKLTEDFD